MSSHKRSIPTTSSSHSDADDAGPSNRRRKSPDVDERAFTRELEEEEAGATQFGLGRRLRRAAQKAVAHFRWLDEEEEDSDDDDEEDYDEDDDEDEEEEDEEDFEDDHKYSKTYAKRQRVWRNVPAITKADAQAAIAAAEAAAAFTAPKPLFWHALCSIRRNLDDLNGARAGGPEDRPNGDPENDEPWGSLYRFIGIRQDIREELQRLRLLNQTRLGAGGKYIQVRIIPSLASLISGNEVPASGHKAATAFWRVGPFAEIVKANANWNFNDRTNYTAATSMPRNAECFFPGLKGLAVKESMLVEVRVVFCCGEDACFYYMSNHNRKCSVRLHKFSMAVRLKFKTAFDSFRWKKALVPGTLSGFYKAAAPNTTESVRREIQQHFQQGTPGPFLTGELLLVNIVHDMDAFKAIKANAHVEGLMRDKDEFAKKDIRVWKDAR